MPNFLYFTSVVSYRVPIKDDGTLGNPEIMGRFTTQRKETKQYNRKKKAPVDATLEDIEVET